jgi:adenylate kinase family enzyme
MSARIVLIGAGPGSAVAGQGELLAAAIRATHVKGAAGPAEVERALAASTEGFVLEGYPRSAAEAAALDAFLDARAASLELALWFRTDAAPTAVEDELLRHYRGRVVEVEVGLESGRAEAELLDLVLDRIREATHTLVG